MRGYLYIAMGQAFVDEAVESLKSLRRFDPDAQATLVTTETGPVPEFNEVRVLEPELPGESDWTNATHFKVEALQDPPYEKTFFLDTDTRFLDGCTELFDLLDHFDLLITHAPGDVNEVSLETGSLPGYWPYNTGVMVYRDSPRLRAFFKDWLRCFREKVALYTDDQVPFMDAYLRADIKTYLLQTVYNFRSPYFVALVGKKVKILHGREKDYEHVDRVVNARLVPRLWVPGKQKVMYPSDPLGVRIKDAVYGLAPEGLKGVWKKLKG